MTRYWHASQRGGVHAYYRCSVRAGNPASECSAPIVKAEKLDTFVLSVLATVIADPLMLCDWADANESNMAQVSQEVARADATLEALQARLDELARDAARYQRVLEALDSVKDAEEIALYRDKLNAVKASRAVAQAELTAAQPRRDHAQQREWLLRALRYWSENLPQSERQEPTALVESRPTALRVIGDVPLLTPDAAAIHRALEAMPRDPQRRLLRDLEVKVVVSRSYSQAERRARRVNVTPLGERVTVKVGALEVRAQPVTPSVQNPPRLLEPQ